VKLSLCLVSGTNSGIDWWDSLRAGVADCLERALDGAPEEVRGGRSSIVNTGDQGGEA